MPSISVSLPTQQIVELEALVDADDSNYSKKSEVVQDALDQFHESS